jgi:hypothetical protein
MSEASMIVDNALGAITACVPLIKRIGENKKDSEIKAALADIMGQLTKAKIEISNLEQKILDYEKQIRELTEDREKPLKLVGNFYVDEQDNLFCVGCYAKDRIRVPVTRKGGGASCDNYSCPVCNANYPKPLSPEEQKERDKNTLCLLAFAYTFVPSTLIFPTFFKYPISCAITSTFVIPP